MAHVDPRRVARPRRTLTRLAVLGAAAGLALAGCGGEDEDRGSTTGPDRPDTSVATPTGIDPMAGAGTEPVHVRATKRRTALLTDVRAARHEGYDRVVFQFRDAIPGYDVRYTSRPLRQDGSGRVVRVDGMFVVQIRMENALDADLSSDGAPRTYTGPTRIRPQLPQVVELVRTGGFEGVLTWAAGVNDRVDFRARVLSDPPRLVVDFRNH